jgi:hypothetical protein
VTRLLGALCAALLVGSLAHGQAVTLYRDPTTDVAPIGVIELRSQATDPTTPAAGANVYIDADNALVYHRAGETVGKRFMTAWRGTQAETEVSTNSTTYTTAITLAVPVFVEGDYELMIYCEIAGSDTSTRVWLEADIDEVSVVAEVNFGFSETYANEGWRPFMAMCFAANVAVADHVLTLRYKVNNGAKTGYLRRARVRCVRVN